MSNLDFNCDRQAKNDFTASTYAVITGLSSYSAVNYYELNKQNELVPYGDTTASETSHYDVYVEYITSAWTKWYVFELKERTHPNDRYPTAYINEEKWPQFVEYRDNGITPCWCELYTDNTLRIWNLENTDFCHLPISRVPIKKINIDPASPKVIQLRRNLPMDEGKIIRRIKGGV